jgi:curved DNA-binding protein CbpA
MTAMSSSTFYDILGVPRGATTDQIRRAYRSRAQKLHPDVNAAPDAAARFAEVQNAYEVLSNPNRRREYDLSLDGLNSAPAEPAVAHYSWRNVATEASPDPAAGQNGPPRTELDDIYDAFFGRRGG